MRFSDVLNGYIEQIGCSAKELSDASQVSPAVISRYRSGERIPNADGPQLQAIAAGIERLSEGNPELKLSRDDVLRTFMEAITGIRVSYEAFLSNLNTLVVELGISNNELARALSFDPSYISRILAGQRHPADMPQFVSVVSRYVARRYTTGPHSSTLARITGTDLAASTSELSYAHAVAHWLGSNIETSADSITEFLQTLDSFDLGAYVRNGTFDRLEKLPTPTSQPSPRTYTGLDQMMQAELDFLALAQENPADDDIIMYTDMPISDMARNPLFLRSWMSGMAALLKKGARIRMIHDVNRPFHEMMVGLESWIPMYMAGQVSPYYLHNSQCDVFCHLLKSAGNAALAGEAISGHQADGRYILAWDKENVRYYRDQARHLIKRAYPLMDIYRRNDASGFAAFIKRTTGQPGSLRMLLPAPPICTIGPELLMRILKHNRLSSRQMASVQAYAESQRKQIEDFLETGSLQMEVPDIPPEEMADHPALLSLSGAFLEEDIRYDPEEYREHLEQTRAFADEHPNCLLRVNRLSVFRSIKIIIREDDYVLISKDHAPAIHFVVHHPNMVAAFESFVPPISS